MSAEDFSLVTDGESLRCQDSLLEINKYKAQYEAILKEQKILRDGIESNKYYAKEFKKRANEKKALSEEEDKKRTKTIQKEKEKCRCVQEENIKLQKEILKIKEEMQSLDCKNSSLKKQTEV